MRILIHKKGYRSEWTTYRSIFLLSLPGRVHAKMPRKYWAKTEWYPVRFLSLPQHSEQLFSFSKFSRNPGCMPKPYRHVLSTSGRYMAGFLVKRFGGCCENTVLTGASCWASSNCIPAQKVVPLSTELNHNRSALVLDSDIGLYSGT